MSVSPRSSSVKLLEMSKLNAASSSMDWSARSVETIGPSLVFETVSEKVSEAECSPSDATTIMERLPTSLFSGVPEISPVAELMESHDQQFGPIILMCSELMDS